MFSLLSKVTTIKTVKQIDELVDVGTDTPIWQRYRLKIMSLSKQVRKISPANLTDRIHALYVTVYVLFCSKSSV